MRAKALLKTNQFARMGYVLTITYGGVLMQAEEVQRLVEKYAAADPEVKALWEEHVLFKKQIEKFESKPALTPAEDQEMKRIKKEKLEGKTKLYAKLESLQSNG